MLSMSITIEHRTILDVCVDKFTSITVHESGIVFFSGCLNLQTSKEGTASAINNQLSKGVITSSRCDLNSAQNVS